MMRRQASQVPSTTEPASAQHTTLSGGEHGSTTYLEGLAQAPRPSKPPRQHGRDELPGGGVRGVRPDPRPESHPDHRPAGGRPDTRSAARGHPASRGPGGRPARPELSAEQPRPVPAHRQLPRHPAVDDHRHPGPHARAGRVQRARRAEERHRHLAAGRRGRRRRKATTSRCAASRRARTSSSTASATSASTTATSSTWSRSTS